MLNNYRGLKKYILKYEYKINILKILIAYTNNKSFFLSSHFLLRYAVLETSFTPPPPLKLAIDFNL
jgi:hypothetical protein